MDKDYLSRVAREVQIKAYKISTCRLIINTPLQQLDYDFKRELLRTARGNSMYCEGWLYRKRNHDYRVARYMAICFNEIMSVYEDLEYSKHNIVSLSKKLSRYAKSEGVVFDRYKICYVKLDRGIKLLIKRNGLRCMSVIIRSTSNSLARGMAKVVGFFASDAYESESDINEVCSYFTKIIKNALL